MMIRCNIIVVSNIAYNYGTKTQNKMYVAGQGSK